MRPAPEQMLGFLAQSLLADIAPLLEQDYAQRSAQIVGMLLTMLAEEWDRSAERLVEENEALQALFADAAEVVRDDALRGRLLQAATRRVGSLKISALSATNDAQRALLIELHAHVEALPTDAASALDERIWSELKASTDRRKLALSPF